MDTLAVLLLSTAFTFASLFAQQPSARQPVQLPELPKQDVSLAPAPISPPQSVPLPERRKTSPLERNVVFVNGALYVKLGDVFLPGPGSCCFCPDGVERRPLTRLEVERLSQSPGSRSNR
jgi:hypothetical protein